MARPVKEGVEYFPLDVNFYRNRKLRRVIKAQGEKSIGIWVVVLAMIYEDKGYYVTFDENMCFDIADICGVTEGAIMEFVKAAIQAELFNSFMFDSFNILTSKGIQEQYAEIIKKSKRKNEIEDKYRVSSNNEVVSPEETPENPEENTQNEEESTQRKRKKRKVNKNKRNHSMYADEDTPIRIQALSDFEKLWQFPNEFQREDLFELVDKHGDDLVSAAVKLAGSKDVLKGKAINFLRSALNEWSDNNIKTVEQAREYQKTRGKQRLSGYSKAPVRTESMPKWANDQTTAEDEPVSEEEEAAFREKLKKIRERKNQHAGSS